MVMGRGPPFSGMISHHVLSTGIGVSPGSYGGVIRFQPTWWCRSPRRLVRGYEETLSMGGKGQSTILGFPTTVSAPEFLILISLSLYFFI